MPAHSETKILPYYPDQLFDLVADIEKYPRFLPWLMASRITSRDGDVLYADLLIGFQMFREKYRSRVVLERPRRIDVEYVEGPFRNLENHWQFIEVGERQTQIHFSVDFEFDKPALQKAIGPVFTEAVKRMVGAFEIRARLLYAPLDILTKN